VPVGISDEPMEKANKAIVTLVIITLLLCICFIPVFKTYQVETASYTAEALAKLDLYRMYWLIGALLAVVGGLMVSYFLSKKKSAGWGAMQYPQVILGMLAIFTYVGVEVAIGSNLGELLRLPEFGSHTPSEIAPYISMYWGSLMIGRWAGAIAVFNLQGTRKSMALVIVPLIAFSIIVLVNTIAQKDMTPLYYYVFCVIIQIIAFCVSKDKPARTLLIFAFLGAVAMVIGLMTEG